MRISVFGAGYVGAVTAACLTDDGHHVVAVDVNPSKVEMLGRGQAPIVEAGLGELLRAGVEKGLLRATTNAQAAIAETDASLICVGTPSSAIGELDLSFVSQVSEQIGAALRGRNEQHTLIYRSTMLPGSMERVVRPALERGLGAELTGAQGLAYLPEFLRESTAIADYRDPGLVVIGVEDPQTLEIVEQLHRNISAERFITNIRTAEAIKYVNNCWHATKISFANEIGNICRESGIDGQAVMRAVCADQRLNISTAYMRPGMAYGGSCLPKDLRALRRHGSRLGVPTPLLDGVSNANEVQIARAFDLVAKGPGNRVTMLGLSFKEATDDLRESPLVVLAERLYGKGFELKIVDRNVREAALMGANLEYINRHLPHLAALLTDDIDAAIADADTVVIGQKSPEFVDAAKAVGESRQVVDLVRAFPDRTSGEGYSGICW